MIDALLPEGVGPLAASAVILVSFFSSMATAALGLGGGLILLAVMTAAFPPAAVIPVHGVAQLGSNLSRFAFLRQYTAWFIIAWFAAGGAIGAGLGARVAIALPGWLLQTGVGLFILAMVWAPKPKAFNPGPASYFSAGAASSFLTMFFGATGPLTASVLSTSRLQRMQVVSTHAAAMVVQHGLKTAAFGLVGFAFAEWAAIIAGILLAGFLGAWIGARLLKKMPEPTFKGGFKALISLVALYLIGAGLAAALS